jgi:hypothetical protein
MAITIARRHFIAAFGGVAPASDAKACIRLTVASMSARRLGYNC